MATAAIAGCVFVSFLVGPGPRRAPVFVFCGLLELGSFVWQAHALPPLLFKASRRINKGPSSARAFNNTLGGALCAGFSVHRPKMTKSSHTPTKVAKNGRPRTVPTAPYRASTRRAASRGATAPIGGLPAPRPPPAAGP